MPAATQPMLQDHPSALCQFFLVYSEMRLGSRHHCVVQPSLSDHCVKRKTLGRETGALWSPHLVMKAVSQPWKLSFLMRPHAPELLSNMEGRKAPQPQARAC